MGFRVIGVGEALWDLLPTSRQLGGAPANFTYQAQCLGADAALITRIGNDPLGKDLLQQLKQKNLSQALVQTDGQYSTGTVGVTFPSHGTPQYTIHENAAWDHLVADQQALMAIAHADAVCFGSLAQRSPASRESIHTLLLAAPRMALRIFDINLRQDFFTLETIETSLQLANALKLNSEELEVLTDLFRIQGTTEQKIMWLSHTYELHTIALTQGSEGSILYHQGDWSTETSRKIDIADTIGAGDAFTAALTIGFLHRLKPEIIHRFATEVSGYVCSQAGGMPPLPGTLRDRITQIAPI